MNHKLSDLYIHVARSTNKYESTQTRAKAEASLPEYLEIINIHNNDPFIEELSQIPGLCVYQNPTSGNIRGMLGKGLKDFQEGDVVALIAGVNMPMIIWKKGSSYRSKGLAYIYRIM
jgi:hypothetical protein